MARDKPVHDHLAALIISGNDPEDSTTTDSDASSSSDTDEEELPKPCPFLTIPAELRLQIYTHALAPGVLHLHSTKTHRFAVTPTISPALLRVNRQIHAEASTLLESSNEVTLTLPAHETGWPLINEKRLPQNVLSKLQHLFIILDCSPPFRQQWSYADVDWTPFSALTALKTLRIAVLYDVTAPTMMYSAAERFSSDRAPEMFMEMLMRVPRGTKVLCKVEKGSAQELIRDEVLGKMRKGVAWFDEDKLEAAANSIDPGTRGTWNGCVSDVSAQHRYEN